MPSKLATKSKIVMCFFQLLQKKAYDKITVKNICKQAGISRMTFYRNFHAKDDLIIYHLDIMYTSFLQQLLTNPTHSLYDVMNLFLQAVKDDSAAMQGIRQNNLEAILRSRMNYYVQQLSDSQVIRFRGHATPIVISMISGGLTDLLLAWTDDGMKEPVESLVVSISKYIRL